VAEQPYKAPRWLGFVPLVPMAAGLFAAVPGLLGLAMERPGLSVPIAIGVIGLWGLLIGRRVQLAGSIRRRILRARPTTWCQTCGYASDGLDVVHVDSGTLPFDRTRCPECGRANPR